MMAEMHALPSQKKVHKVGVGVDIRLQVRSARVARGGGGASFAGEKTFRANAHFLPQTATRFVKNIESSRYTRLGKAKSG